MTLTLLGWSTALVCFVLWMLERHTARGRKALADEARRHGDYWYRSYCETHALLLATARSILPEKPIAPIRASDATSAGGGE